MDAAAKGRKDADAPITKFIAAALLAICAILLLCGGLANMITVVVIVAIVIAVQTLVARMKAA